MYRILQGPGFRSLLVFGTLATGSTGVVAAPIQSPIDIRSEYTEFATMAPLMFDYGFDVDLEVVNNGSPAEESTVRSNVPLGAGSISVAGVVYDLLQFHFHTESEHLLNGVGGEMELHMVHQAMDGTYLVVGQLIDLGSQNLLLDPIFSSLPPSSDSTTVTGFNLSGLVPVDLRSYRYLGSLTTSPYTEGVNWVILHERLTFSAAQIDAFRTLFFEGNERDVQAINGRMVSTDVMGFAAVPEPGMSTLLLFGGTALLLIRRRVS